MIAWEILVSLSARYRVSCFAVCYREGGTTLRDLEVPAAGYLHCRRSATGLTYWPWVNQVTKPSATPTKVSGFHRKLSNSKTQPPAMKTCVGMNRLQDDYGAFRPYKPKIMSSNPPIPSCWTRAGHTRVTPATALTRG